MVATVDVQIGVYSFIKVRFDGLVLNEVGNWVELLKNNYRMPGNSRSPVGPSVGACLPGGPSESLKRLNVAVISENLCYFSGLVLGGLYAGEERGRGFVKKEYKDISLNTFILYFISLNIYFYFYSYTLSLDLIHTVVLLIFFTCEGVLSQLSSEGYSLSVMCSERLNEVYIFRLLIGFGQSLQPIFKKHGRAQGVEVLHVVKLAINIGLGHNILLVIYLLTDLGLG